MPQHDGMVWGNFPKPPEKPEPQAPNFGALETGPFQILPREREIADQLRADIDVAQRRPNLLEGETREQGVARMVRQAHEKARLEHQVIAEAEIGEITKSMQTDVAKHAAIRAAPDVVLDANESARAAELYAYIPKAKLGDLGRVLDEETARGGKANLRVMDVLYGELLERLKAVPHYQRDGSPIERLERRARNLRDRMRQGAPSLTEADVAAPHKARRLAAEQRHRFFRRATGL